MSSSSESEEDEDLKRAAAAVDATFLNSYRSVVEGIEVSGEVAAEKRKSERHLVTQSHYNDVRVPEELQRRIARKLSAVIEKSVEFVPPHNAKVKKRKIKGGVKLFSCSTACLDTELVEDTETRLHNQRAKERRRNGRSTTEGPELTEQDKLSMCAVTAERIQSGDDTKHWKSRRKEKLYKYKKQNDSNVLISLEFNGV